MRPSLDPFSPENGEILTASFYRAPEYYDPLLHHVENPDALRALMGESDASGRPLFVNVGRHTLTAMRVPDIHAMVEDDALFETVATRWGFDPRGSRRVYRYRGAAPSPEPTPPR
jgi:hypothetical protein